MGYVSFRQLYVICLYKKSQVGLNSSGLLFLSLRGGRELPGRFCVVTKLCLHGGVDVAMALRTPGGDAIFLSENHDVCLVENI